MSPFTTNATSFTPTPTSERFMPVQRLNVSPFGWVKSYSGHNSGSFSHLGFQMILSELVVLVWPRLVWQKFLLSSLCFVLANESAWKHLGNWLTPLGHPDTRCPRKRCRQKPENEPREHWKMNHRSTYVVLTAHDDTDFVLWVGIYIFDIADVGWCSVAIIFTATFPNLSAPPRVPYLNSS